MFDELSAEDEQLLASGISPASEMYVRDDETVCATTGYTYNANLSKSPHVDKDGYQSW